MPPVSAEAAASFHALSVAETLQTVFSTEGGLTSAEATARQQRFGPNSLRITPPTPAWKILIAQLRSVVVYLLAVAALFSLVAGDPLDAAAIAVVLLINTALGFFTEYRARQAMRALLALEAPRATVHRDGAVVEIPARELVPGDVIDVEAGHAVPADARLIAATDLRVNEAALTGESAPVLKTDAPVETAAPLPDRRSMIFSGTLIAAGSARAVVVHTGAATELGRIGQLVSDVETDRTPLERRLDALGRRLAFLAVLAGVAVAGLGLLQGVDAATVVQTAIALAIAAVPEGLPAVATIALAVGLRRMAKRNALVRRLPAVETLGAVGIIGSDKTGTLTAGRMTVAGYWLNGLDVELKTTAEGVEFSANGEPLDESQQEHLDGVLRIGVLANRASVEGDEADSRIRGDPTEAALLIAAAHAGIRRADLIDAAPEAGHIPFSSERMWMATFHGGGDAGYDVAVKGAADRIVSLCTRVATVEGETVLDERWRTRILEENRRAAAGGLRILGLARGRADDIGEPTDLVFLGLAGLIDPPAEGVRETILSLQEAGIRTVMITGDQEATALAVARDLGIAGEGTKALDGRELAELDEVERREVIPSISVFSRVSPEQKLRIITAFQASGAVVAMLGDGVNDAAALKKADIGVAMGIRGTDVAKEVASVVLRDDRFPTIAAAVEQGRIIYDNIRKFVFYLFSCNLAEVLLLLGAGIVGLPVPLTPLQILWLNIVTDTFPALALAFEPAETDVMRRPPRDPSHALLSVPFLRAVAFYGVLMAVSSGAAFWLGLTSGDGESAQTIAFMTLALAQAFHLGNARSTGPVLRPARAFANRYALAAVALVVGLQLASVYFKPLADVLGTMPLTSGEWLIVVPLALLAGVTGQILEVVSEWRRRRTERPAHVRDASG